jgi:hypothetical protein
MNPKNGYFTVFRAFFEQLRMVMNGVMVEAANPAARAAAGGTAV